MQNRLFVILLLAGLLGVGAGCWRSGDACRTDADCNGTKKCLQSGGVVFGNGVCVRPCTTERLRELCREQGGTCSGEFCVEFNPDADIVGGDGGPFDGDGGPPDVCTRPDDDEYCESRGLPCGPENNPVEGRDRCGNTRSVDCNSVIDFETEARHCGGCGNECTFSNADGTQNADGDCREGQCVIDSCTDGYRDKDGDGSNGCECGVTEEVCDGEDNDCDGEVDEEDCECIPGDQSSCYTGADDTAETGICEKGSWTCRQDGTWSPCMGETTPADEKCGNGVDEDCNGTTDNGCPCEYKGLSEGVCADRVRDENGACPEPTDYEPDETSCGDGFDNDCDGVVDENCPCDYDGTTKGVCGQATRDDIGNCQKPTEYEQPETRCTDKLDNDCDGDVDAKDIDCQCDYDGTSDGVCGNATRDKSGTCEQPPNYQSPETTCDDGLDNDCDGAVDEKDGDC